MRLFALFYPMVGRSEQTIYMRTYIRWLGRIDITRALPLAIKIAYRKLSSIRRRLICRLGGLPHRFQESRDVVAMISQKKNKRQTAASPGIIAQDDRVSTLRWGFDGWEDPVDQNFIEGARTILHHSIALTFFFINCIEKAKHAS